MSAYLNTTIIDAAIGTDTRLALTDNDPTTLSQLIALASSVVDAALSNAGHAVPLTDAIADLPGVVHIATLGQFMILAYQRKGLEVPESARTATGILNAIAKGDVPIPGKTPEAQEAVGGGEFTDSDPDSEEGKPRIFGGLRTIY